MTAASSIVVIEDETAIRKLLRTALEGAGHRILEAETGKEGLVTVAQRQPDLVILDIGLPDADGVEILRHLREWSDVPVIILTVRDDPDEKIAALDTGADDFVTKPFHTGELLARIRSVTKRLHPSTQEAVSSVGPLRIDFLERAAHIHGQRLEVTLTEFRILQTLARHAGKIVTKTALLRAVWGESTTSSDDHLRVHMAAVRRKLRAFDCDGLIATEIGVGYRLVAPER